MLDGRDEPGLTVHGSFSLMVNYHALGRWLAGRGGELLCTTHLHSSLNVVAGLLGKLGQLEAAREQVEQALAEAPDFEPAVELRQEIAAALKASRPRKRPAKGGRKQRSGNREG